MPRFNRPCLNCGGVTSGSRCENCGTNPNRKTSDTTTTRTPEQEAQRKLKKAYLYGGNYRERARVVRETATHCHICKKQFLPGDRIEADHLYPELGYSSALAPAHRACNQSRGNKPIQDDPHSSKKR